MYNQIKASGEYVFKNTLEGIKFVGDFDGLYKNDDDPWGQKNDVYYHNRRLDIVNAVADLNPSSVLDVGCGFGHTTQALKILVTSEVTGVDISKVAVDKANKLFPDVKFSTLDVIKTQIKDTYDTIILDGILWYILPDLGNIIKKLHSNISTSGHLVIAQAFIPNQKYGVEIINGYEGLLRFLLKYDNKYKLYKTIHKDTGNRKTDSITILQKRS